MCEYFYHCIFPFSGWLLLAQFYVWGNWIIGKVIHRKNHSRFENLFIDFRDCAFIHYAADPEIKLRFSVFSPYLLSVIFTVLVSLTEFLYINSLSLFLCCDLKHQVPNFTLRVRQGNTSHRVDNIYTHLCEFHMILTDPYFKDTHLEDHHN